MPAWVIPALSVAVTAAGVGASAAGAFTPSTPKPPTFKSTNQARERKLLEQASRKGFQSTIIAGPGVGSQTVVGRPTVTGSSV